MEFFKIRRDIPFMRHALVFNLISLATFLAAVFFLFSRGLHLSVEFTGGTLMEVSYSQPADLGNSIRATVAKLGMTDVQIAELWHGTGCADSHASAKAAVRVNKVNRFWRHSRRTMRLLRCGAPSL